MAKTHAGKEYYISTTAVAKADFDKTEAEGLSYIKIGPTVAQFPRYGKNRAIASQKGHSETIYGFGVVDYGSGPMQVAHEATDPGQVALRALNHLLYYVIKVDHNDETGAGTGDFTATFDYLLCKISGPDGPDGGDEDFDAEEYNIGIEGHIPVLPAVIV